MLNGNGFVQPRRAGELKYGCSAAIFRIARKDLTIRKFCCACPRTLITIRRSLPAAGRVASSARERSSHSRTQETRMSAVPNEVMKYVAAEHDDDPQETVEWLESLDGVISSVGTGRAHYLIEKQIEFARMHGEHLPFSANTPYINTIPVAAQARSRVMGHRAPHPFVRAGTRWRWCCAQARTRTSAATSHRSHRPRRSMTSATTTSGTQRPSSMAAISCSCRATRRRASTRARSCSAA